MNGVTGQGHPWSLSRPLSEASRFPRLRAVGLRKALVMEPVALQPSARLEARLYAMWALAARWASVVVLRGKGAREAPAAFALGQTKSTLPAHPKRGAGEGCGVACWPAEDHGLRLVLFGQTLRLRLPAVVGYSAKAAIESAIAFLTRRHRRYFPQWNPFVTAIAFALACNCLRPFSCGCS